MKTCCFEVLHWRGGGVPEPHQPSLKQQLALCVRRDHIKHNGHAHPVGLVTKVTAFKEKHLIPFVKYGGGSFML